MSSVQIRLRLKQPSVFKLAFFTAMFERFGFYLLTDLLVLYMKASYHYSDSQAFTLFAIFNALVYITPAIGGYLSDNVIGIRRSIVLGLIMEGVGLLLLSTTQASHLAIGLAFIIIGVGFFKVGPTHLLARSYENNDPRIDSGFTLYYMAINIGSLFSAILAGVIQHFLGWHVVFLLASVSLLAGLISYLLLRSVAKPLDSNVGKKTLPFSRWTLLGIGIVLVLICVTLLVSHTQIAEIVFFVATAALFVYFMYEIVRSRKEEKLKIIAALILIILGLIFFVFYYQAYTSITLFIKRSVVRHIFGIDIPTVTFLFFNPFWILALSPVLAAIYNQLARHRADFAVTTKFIFGLFLIAICFLTLYLSTVFHNADAKVSPLWIVLVYFLYSFAELLISALGFAMVTRIAPKRLYGVMMGAWFLVGQGLSSSISGMFANLASIPSSVTDPLVILHIYGHAFLEFAIIGTIMAFVGLSINPYIKHIAKLD